MSKIYSLLSLCEGEGINKASIDLEDDYMKFDSDNPSKIQPKHEKEKEDDDEDNEDDHDKYSDDEEDDYPEDDGADLKAIKFDFDGNGETGEDDELAVSSKFNTKDDPSSTKDQTDHKRGEDGYPIQDISLRDEHPVKVVDDSEDDQLEDPDNSKTDNSNGDHPDTEINGLIQQLKTSIGRYNMVVNSLTEYDKMDSIKEKGLISALKEIHKDSRDVITELEQKQNGVNESFFQDADEDVVQMVFDLQNQEAPLRNSLIYDFSDKHAEYDELQSFIEDNLAKYGVKSANVDKDDKNNQVNIDLEFSKNAVLTFCLGIKDGSGLPTIECKHGKEVKSQTLPTNFSAEQKISIKNAFTAFPLDFVVTCIKEFMPEHQLKESLILEMKMSSVLSKTINAKYRKKPNASGKMEWVENKEPIARRNMVSSCHKKSIKQKKYCKLLLNV